MKKLFTLISLACFAISNLSAQITIISDDITPIGTEAFQTTDTLPDASIQPGGTGQQTWDFSALKSHGSLTFSFFESATTPYADLFPDANLAGVQGDNYFYFSQNQQELVALGTYGEFEYEDFLINTALYIDPPQSLLRFPTNLDDAYTETIVRSAQIEGSVIDAPFDSVRIESTVNRSVVVDAYGELTSPLGTYNCLRTTEIEEIVDQVYVYSATTMIWTPLPAGNPYTNKVYNFWTNENDFVAPLVQLEEDEVLGIIQVNWLIGFASDAEERFDLEFGLYPNPAPNELFVDFPAQFEGNLEVMTMNGQMLHRQPVTSSKENISTDEFAPGTYLLVIRDERGGLAAAKQFQVVR